MTSSRFDVGSTKAEKEIDATPQEELAEPS